MRSLLTVLSISLFCGMVLNACSSAPGNMNVKADGTIEGTDPTGKVAFKAGKTEYPSGLPVAQYPGSEVTFQSNNSDPGSSGMSKQTAMLRTSDTSDKILPFYKDQLKNAGWTIDNVIEGQASNIFAKKDQQQINISIMAGANPSDGTTINIALQ